MDSLVQLISGISAIAFVFLTITLVVLGLWKVFRRAVVESQTYKSEVGALGHTLEEAPAKAAEAQLEINVNEIVKVLEHHRSVVLTPEQQDEVRSKIYDILSEIMQKNRREGL